MSKFIPYYHFHTNIWVAILIDNGNGEAPEVCVLFLVNSFIEVSILTMLMEGI